MSGKSAEINRQTTINPAFNAVARDEFASMIEVERYLDRSDSFETLIARTNEHFWNPEDPDYIDYESAPPVDEPLIPFTMVPERHSAIWDTLDEKAQLKFTNESLRARISGILHGEQGALSLSTGLSDMFVDPGAQEYATNQAREESRHVHAFALYMRSRFGGEITPPTPTLNRILSSLVASEIIYEKVIGMQMIIEGIAMGLFASMYQEANDPLLKRVCQLVMTDESFHHRFGRIWAEENVPGITEELRDQLEDYAREMFNDVLMNLVGADQKIGLYRRCGIDPDFAVAAMNEAITDDTRRRFMQDGTNIFRTLIKTLWQGGLITERSRPYYANWIDMDEISGEGRWNVGDEIAEEGIASLREINAGKRRVVRKVSEGAST
ncbi:MAG: ferritin-like domain-containing protein [Deltaproteobacteria bacterium]